MKSYTPATPYGGRHVDRDERRGANSRPRNMLPPQSRQAVNLGRLGAALGTDVLGAALGLTEQSLRILLDGRDPSREAQYQPHLEHKFEDADIPLSWLSRENPTLEPEYLQALRVLAAQSPSKAPIRRVNFKRLAKAFDGRIGVLADAVEMNQAAVMNVAEGHLELDEYRFNHLNPRLMRAGFPDGWLEQPNPDLTDSMLESLEQVATDDYEQELSSSELVEQTVGQAFVSPVPAQVVSAQEKLADVGSTAAPIIEHKKEEPTMETTAQSQPHPAEENTSVPPFAQTEFSAAGFPGTRPPMQHPAAAGAPKLPTRLLAAGRKVPGTSAPQAKPTAPVAAKPAKPTAAAKPAVAPAPNKSKAPITKEASLARAEALNQLLDTARRGAKDALWKRLMSLSLPYWGNIRRGTVLFRDELAQRATDALELPQGWLDNPTFPPATLAAWVTDPSVPLPGAKEKPAAMAAVVETLEPVASPVAPAVAPAAPATQPMIKPFARPKAQLQAEILAAPEPVAAAAPVAEPIRVEPAAVAVVVEAAVEPVPAIPVTAAPAQPVAAAPVAAPAAPTVAPATAAQVKLSMAGFSWTPPQGQPGPICQALVSTLSGMSAAGVLTEQDALQMLNELLGRR